MSKYSASGSLYGYLFQFDRALYWLACQERGTKVGIETEDDVVSVDSEGKIIREQDKCSISGSNFPLSDRSKGLWKTLKIWVEAIKNEEVDLSKTQFYLVTNEVYNECLAREMGEAKDKGSIDLCLEKLKDLGRNPSNSIKDYTKSVLDCDDELLREMINRIYFADSKTTRDDLLRESIVSNLHIPETLPSDEIVDSLLGWMISRAKELWRNDKPAWITREELDAYYFEIASRFKSQRFIETAKRDLLPRIDANSQKYKDRIFVRQVSLLDLEEESVLNSIKDFLCCTLERTRIAEKGFLTKDQLEKFDNNLVERWEIIFMRHSRDDALSEIRRGISTYTDTLDHREPLAGQPIENYYLTRGTYHMLADILEVGWHPKFKELIKSDEVDS